jgi:hypothetical protein
MAPRAPCDVVQESPSAPLQRSSPRPAIARPIGQNDFTLDNETLHHSDHLPAEAQPAPHDRSFEALGERSCSPWALSFGDRLVATSKFRRD